MLCTSLARALPIIILDFLRATVYVEVRAAAQIFSRAAGGGRAATEPNVRGSEREQYSQGDQSQAPPRQIFLRGRRPARTLSNARAGLPSLLELPPALGDVEAARGLWRYLYT